MENKQPSLAEIISKAQRIAGTSNISLDEYEELRWKWANEPPENLDGVQCKECMDKGYVLERRGHEFVSIECRCMKQKRSLQRIKKSGLSDLLDRYTFDTYQTPEKWQKEAKQKAMDFLKDHSGKWFLASGNPGSGKTHLCTAICGCLIQSGASARYFLWRDDGSRLKAVINDSEAYSEMARPLKSVKVLYIDDFWKSPHGKVTDGDINLAFEILNARYNREDLVTIISTELSFEQILDIDEGVGSRLYERCKDYYVRSVGKDKNWRLRKA